jgi:two-component system LytT family response regulator
MNVFIVEDEEHSRKTLVNFLHKYTDGIRVMGSSDHVSDAIEQINEKRPDLVFLDIDLPDGNGFEVLDGINHFSPKVIFVTAYNQYAIKAFQVSAIDYLLKPVDPLLLKKAVEKARSWESTIEEQQKLKQTLTENRKSSKLEKLALPTQQGMQFVKIDDIIRIEADGNYATLYLVSGEKKLISKSLKQFQTWLEGLNFFRIHHSHIININNIKEYIKGEGGFVILDNGHQVEVSRRRKEEFLKVIGI